LVPLPESFPELPISEKNTMRPMSPYATSKVFGDFITRNYHVTYGLNTVVSRAFNHEGSGRGHDFVTSSIVRQTVSAHLNEQEAISIGDVTVFRDWSHVQDIVNGYILLAENACPGSAYIQGSSRTHSVLTYILETIRLLGYRIDEIKTIKGDKMVKEPLENNTITIGNNSYISNKIDELLYTKKINYTYDDGGFDIATNKRNFKIIFDINRFRPSDVPILLSNTSEIQHLGFKTKKQLTDIISDQTNYYLDPNHRLNIISNKC
jgi:GDPmannose 4,6-dehydratase